MLERACSIMPLSFSPFSIMNFSLSYVVMYVYIKSSARVVPTQRAGIEPSLKCASKQRNRQKNYCFLDTFLNQIVLNLCKVDYSPYNNIKLIEISAASLNKVQIAPVIVKILINIEQGSCPYIGNG